VSLARDRGTARYDNEFFAYHEDAALASARTIVPILLRLIQPASVVDVGCGRGAWLRAFQEHGVSLVRGFDGRHVDRSKLLIDPDRFTAVDLAAPLNLEGPYELALCLEVAEHLPPKAGRRLVRALTAAAPLVLFSAAVPGQGGTSHVNEQWPWYWDELFLEHGFQRLDPVRRHVRQNQQVKWWYRQNLVLYANGSRVSDDPALQEEALLSASSPFEWVHLQVVTRRAGFRALLRELPGSALRSLKRQVRQPLPKHGDHDGPHRR
jgi:SAM-dependent methyltransferase